MLIGELFGTQNHKLVRSISSSGKYMFIDFKMQHAIYSGNDIEFEASIKYNKINLDCQTWLNHNKNVLLSSPSHQNINCSWLITGQFGSYIILDFNFIEVNFV